MNNSEKYISVDVETAGPIPGKYSLLSIGACVVGEPGAEFSCQLKPVSINAAPGALEVSGLSLDELARSGLEAREAMDAFSHWLDEVCAGAVPVFVGLNAPFDWSFINYYFHFFLGRNPFGFSALDIKSLYMGVTGCSWDDTRSSRMARDLKPSYHGDHNALHDARAQAEIFELILKRGHARRG